MPGGLGAVWVVALESGAVLLAAGLAEALVAAGFFAAGFFAAGFFAAGFLAAFFFMARNLQQVLRVRQFSGPRSSGTSRRGSAPPRARRPNRTCRRGRLDGLAQVGLCVRPHDAGPPAEAPIRDPPAHARLDHEVSHPVRALAMLGDQGDAPLPHREPDLDRAAAHPNAGRGSSSTGTEVRRFRSRPLACARIESGRGRPAVSAAGQSWGSSPRAGLTERRLGSSAALAPAPARAEPRPS